MEKPILQKQVLIIAGMHRSGTTFTARWLQSCGLFIGYDLLQTKYDHANPNGEHFEDKDFLKLHRDILQANGLSRDGFVTDEAITISPPFRQQAGQIISARNQQENWGWKEPRTCLFLDLWDELLPNTFKLVVYRDYRRVADSLLRRKVDHQVLARRLFYRLRYYSVDRHCAHFINVWTRYNNDILAAIEHHPQQNLVLRIGDIVPHSQAIIRFMNTQWGFNLEPVNAAEIYEPNRMQEQTSYVSEKSPLVQQAVEEAERTFQMLEVRRKQSIDALRGLA